MKRKKYMMIPDRPQTKHVPATGSGGCEALGCVKWEEGVVDYSSVIPACTCTYDDYDHALHPVSDCPTHGEQHMAVHTERIEEQFHRFGRNVEHDPRSWSYRLDDAVADVEIRSVNWRNMSGVLNQGSLGACVGYATQALCTTGSNWTSLGSTAQVTLMNRYIGLELYKEATRLDEIEGEYPPTDTGSSGLGGAKAAQKRQYIKGYTHAFSYDVMLKALMLGPLMVGTNWYDSMLQVSPDGTIHISSTAHVVGGHQYLVYGYDKAADKLLCQNSWGVRWGVRGKFNILGGIMKRLLGERGDAIQFVPLDQPAPTPAPVPVVSAEDLQLWTAIQAWKLKKGIT